MSKSNNDLPKFLGTSSPNEDDIPRYDQENESHASIPPPLLIVLPNLHYLRPEKFKLTKSLMEMKHEDGKPVCAHVLKMKSRIARLRMLGVDFSKKLAVD
ncbi:hypothetical protein Lser_V15G33133 [Lactuca serriola]